MIRCVYTSPPFRRSPLLSFSDTPRRARLAFPFADYHDGIQQPAHLHSSFAIVTCGGGLPASATASSDIFTCQWEDCHALFRDLSQFIHHVHAGAPHLCLPSPRCPDFSQLPQITQTCTNPTTTVNGPRAPIVVSLRLLASHLSFTSDYTSTKRLLPVSYLVRILPPPKPLSLSPENHRV